MTHPELKAEAAALLALDEKRTPGEWPKDFAVVLAAYDKSGGAQGAANQQFIGSAHRMAACIRSLLAALREAEKDAAYLRWRMTEIVPLFEEARDALQPITEAQARLHNISLSLGDRMDAAGTRPRSEFDAINAEGKT